MEIQALKPKGPKKPKRLPRPKGTTELAHTLSKEPNEQNHNKLITHIINHYIHTGFTYCNQPLTIDQFCILLNINKDIVNKAIINNGNNMYQLLDGDKQIDLLGALFATALSEQLADRSRALQQYNVLANAQGQTYKPFISGEVNRALKLTLDTSAQMQNLIRSLIGSQGPNVIINNNNQNAQTTNHLTTEMALELIKQQSSDKAPLLEDPTAKDKLFLEHGLADTPEVQAHKQQGLDTSKEGLDFTNLAQISDAILVEDEGDIGPKSHTDRRAKELDVDLDSDAI